MRMQLIEAVKNFDEERIRALLGQGLNLAYQDKEGYSALMLACQLGQEKVVQALLMRKAPVNQHNFYGDTALTLALHHKKVSVAKDLIKAGADVNQANFRGYTPLMFASSLDDEELLYMLLSKGAKVNEKAEGDETAVMIASAGGNLKSVQTLVKAGAHLRAQDQAGETAFTWAKTFKRQEVADFIQQTVTDEAFANEFYFALSNNKTDKVKNYLKQGFNPNYQDKEGWTMLLFATYHGLEKITEYLLEFGASVLIKSKEGIDALQLAKKNHQTFLLPYLEKAFKEQQKPQKIGENNVLGQVDVRQNQRTNG